MRWQARAAGHRSPVSTSCPYRIIRRFHRVSPDRYFSGKPVGIQESFTILSEAESHMKASVHKSLGPVGVEAFSVS